MGIGPDRQSAFATEGFAGRVGLRVRGQDGRRRYAAGAVKNRQSAVMAAQPFFRDYS